jgi:hypothetical protein
LRMDCAKEHPGTGWGVDTEVLTAQCISHCICVSVDKPIVGYVVLGKFTILWCG